MSDRNSEAEKASADARALAIRAAVAKLIEIMEEHSRAQQEEAHALTLLQQAQARVAQTIEKYKQLAAIGPLFGFDLDQEYLEHMSRQIELLPPTPFAQPRTLPEQAMSTAAIAASERPKPSVRERVVAIAKTAYPDPVRASAIRQQLEEIGLRLHDKTIGMTLYRLSREGSLRRTGWNWFFVPEDQRHAAANPQAEESPGDEPGLQLEAAD